MTIFFPEYWTLRLCQNWLIDRDLYSPRCYFAVEASGILVVIPINQYQSPRRLHHQASRQAVQ